MGAFAGYGLRARAFRKVTESGRLLIQHQFPALPVSMILSDTGAGVVMGAVSGFKRVLLSSVLGITGCAQTRISAPAVAALQQSEMQFVCGRLDYNGSNPEWLPRAVRAQTDNTHDLIRYRYEVRYGIDDESAFDLFNPFLVFGATKSHDALYVLGELQITSDGRLLKTYREFVTLDKAKSVFSEGETLTAMRQTGLRRVRDLIDTRLAGDKAELDSLGLGCN